MESDINLNYSPSLCLYVYSGADKKISKLRVTGLCEENSQQPTATPVTGLSLLILVPVPMLQSYWLARWSWIDGNLWSAWDNQLSRIIQSKITSQMKNGRWYLKCLIEIVYVSSKIKEAVKIILCSTGIVYFHRPFGCMLSWHGCRVGIIDFYQHCALLHASRELSI